MSPSQPYGPILTNLDGVEESTQSWLWPGRIPLGAITTIVGYGGEGKSFFSCAVASAVSRGGNFCDGAPAPQGSVVVMAGEDLPQKLKSRYRANGADLKKITLLEGQRIYTKAGVTETNVTLRDIDLIRQAIDQQPDVKLLIIDPIGDFIPGINSDKDNEVRALLNPLSSLAKERDLAVLLICHRKKSAGDRADNAALGSVAFTAKARAVHHILVDPNDDAHTSSRRRLLLPGKMNDISQTVGLSFRIVPPDGRIEWDKDPVTQTAEQIMQFAAAKAKADRTADPAALTDTESWLREALLTGPRRASELVTEARLEGIPARTLRAAKLRLKVQHTRLPSRGAYVWELPGADRNAPVVPPTANNSTITESVPPLPPTTNSQPLNYHPAFPPHRVRPRL
jgi:putative DNA primase/helicase